MSNESNRPDLRATTIRVIDTLDKAVHQADGVLTEWGYVDTLRIGQLDHFADTLNRIGRLLPVMWRLQAQGTAKRSSQSVSGRLQPQVTALTHHNERLSQQLIAAGLKPVR